MIESKKIPYKTGYKYQLAKQSLFQTQIIPEKEIFTKYINLGLDGILVIKDGYSWDGPSGPTIDTPSFMRGSLVHDALYQLMRSEQLPLSTKLKADMELKRICIEDGMPAIRVFWVILGLKFAKSATLPSNKKKMYVAPEG